MIRVEFLLKYLCWVFRIFQLYGFKYQVIPIVILMVSVKQLSHKK